MLVSFLISQRNNIPRIRRCIRLICEAWGKSLTASGVYAFPTPEALAEADEKAPSRLQSGLPGQICAGGGPGRGGGRPSPGASRRHGLPGSERGAPAVLRGGRKGGRLHLPFFLSTIWRHFPWIPTSARCWNGNIPRAFPFPVMGKAPVSCSSTCFITSCSVPTAKQKAEDQIPSLSNCLRKQRASSITVRHPYFFKST